MWRTEWMGDKSVRAIGQDTFLSKGHPAPRSAPSTHKVLGASYLP